MSNGNDIKALIDGNIISATFPKGTGIDNLIATFTTSPGALVTVGSTNQESGISANDFSQGDVIYKVSSGDGERSRNYIIKVSIASVKYSEADISRFRFTADKNAALEQDVEAAITAVKDTDNSFPVTVWLPDGVSRTDLIASFEVSLGATVKIGSTMQISGQDSNDFSIPITYTVSSEDKSTTNTYAVTVGNNTLPGKPTDVNAVQTTGNTDGTSVTVSWNAPSDTGMVSGASAAINAYRVYYAEGSSPDKDSAFSETDASGTYLDITDLISGKTYNFAVTAITDAGESALSDTVSLLSKSDEQAVADARAALDLAMELGIDLQAVTADFTLPTTGTDGTSISWEIVSGTSIALSGNSNENAMVSRPNVNNADEDVVLRAAVSKNAARDVVDFNLKVLKESGLSDADSVAAALAALDITEAVGGDLQDVTDDFFLPATGEEGTSISWEVLSGSAIDLSGINNKDAAVTRPSAVTADDDVVIQATATKNGETDTKTFSLKVPKAESLTDAESVARAKADLDTASLGFASGDAFDSVTQDFTLPTIGSDDVSISWNVVSGSAIDLSGTNNKDAAVTRPSFTATDDDVLIEATFTKNGETDTKTFNLKVLKASSLSDAESVAQAKDDLDIASLGFASGDSYDSVTQDFTLPTTGTEGTTISWNVVSGSAIDLSGSNNEDAAVTRPSFTAADDDVVLEATFTKNGETDSKTFNLNVPKAESLNDAESVNQAKDDLDIAGLGFASGDAFDSVTQDFTLPTTGSEGTTISWEVVSGSAIDLSGSSNEDAAVTRPDHTSGNSDVRLRATYSKNGATASEEFDLTVLKKDQVPLAASLTGSISPITIPAGSDSTKTLTFTGASQSLIIGTDIEVRIKTRPNTAAEAHLSMGVNTGVLFPSTDIIPRDGGDYTIELSGIGNYTGTLDRTLNLTVTALPITSISYTAINAETSSALTAAAAPTVDPAEAAAGALFDIDTDFTAETGLSFNTGTGAISGTATAVIDKSYTVSITGGDATKYEGSTQSTSIQVKVTLSDADAVANALSALDITTTVGGNLQAVTGSFALPATGEEGTSISWEVVSGSAIDLSGTNNENAAVTRPSFTAADDDVVIKATVTKNGETDTKTFNLKVLKASSLSDSESVAQAKADLDTASFGFASGDAFDSITQDFTLPTIGSDGVSISWNVVSGSAIDLSGTNNKDAAVTRPSFTATDDDVLIEATFTKNGETDTKTFNLKVLKASSLSDAESVAQAKDDLDIASLGFASGDSYDSVTQDFTLPTTGTEGTTISWNVVSGSAIDLSGSNNEDAAVTRPSFTAADDDVVLEATFTKNGETDSKTFNLNVPKAESLNDAESVNQAKDDLDIAGLGFASGDAFDSVTQDFTLPTTGSEGTTISWEVVSGSAIDLSGSSNEDAAVTRPDHTSGNSDVRLRATYSKNGATVSEEFDLTVLKKDQVPLTASLTGSISPISIPAGSDSTKTLTFTGASQSLIIGTDIEVRIKTRPNTAAEAHLSMGVNTGVLFPSTDIIPRDSGDYTIELSGIGNYTGTLDRTLNLTVTALPITSISYTAINAETSSALTAAAAPTVDPAEAAAGALFDIDTGFTSETGLSFNTGTGAISGTATAVIDKSYTVNITGGDATKYEGSTQSTSIQVKVTLSDADAVANALSALDITTTVGGNLQAVTGSFALPATGEEGTSISWEVLSGSAIDLSGTNNENAAVTRPSFTAADDDVVIKATVTKNGETDTKTFNLKVLKASSLSDSESVAQAKADLDTASFGFASGDAFDSITQDFTLPTIGSDGVSISWNVVSGSAIDLSGTNNKDAAVTRPSFTATDDDVLIEATFTKNGETDSKTFNLKVLKASSLSDAESVAQAKDDLDIASLGFASGDSYDSVTQDFTLPTTGTEGTTISWNVVSGSAIDLSGSNNEDAAVTRPSFTAADDDVVLEATFTKNGETDSKTFNLNVPKAESLNDAESVNQAKDDLDIAGLGFASGDAFDSVTQDFTLPTTGSEGTTISWEVVSGSAIDLSGSSNENAAVTRPDHTSGNSDVRLRATYSKNGATVSEEFDLTVLKKDQVPLTASLTGSISPITIPAGSNSTATLTFTGASQSLIIGTDIEVRIKTRPNTATEAHLSMGVNTGVLFPSTDIIPRDGGDYTIELSGIGNYTGTLDRTLNLTVTALPITSISYTAINAETSTALTAAAVPTVDPAEAAAAALFDIDTGFSAETGLSFNTGTGAISGTASAVIDKSYTISITGGDGTKYEGSTQSTSIQVRVTLSDADSVADALSALDITAAVGGNLQAVTDDFTLPATGEEGTSISWEVLSGSAIDLSGTNNENAAVTRPSFTATDDDVVIKATVTKNGETDTKTFNLKVLKASSLSDAESVNQAKDDLDIAGLGFASGDTFDGVTQDFTLPTTGSEGTTISWEVVSGSAIDLSGTNNENAAVTRPDHTSGNSDVRLRATYSKNGATVSEEFDLTVLKKDQVPLTASLTGSISPISIPAGSDSTKTLTFTGASQSLIIGTDIEVRIKTRPNTAAEAHLSMGVNTGVLFPSTDIIPKDGGDYTIELSGIGNYTGTLDRTLNLTVTALPITSITYTAINTETSTALTAAAVPTVDPAEAAAAALFDIDTGFTTETGLSFDTGTGAISGTASAVIDKSYTVSITGGDATKYEGSTQSTSIQVKVTLSDADAVANALSALDITTAVGGNLQTVTDDFTLPATGEEGTSISWEVLSGSAIDLSGSNNENAAVTRPSFTATDDDVLIKATVTKNGETDTKTFNLKVLKASSLSDAESVNQAKDDLDIAGLGFASGDTFDGITQDFTLPTTGSEGTTISWEVVSGSAIALSGSSNEDAAVTRPDHTSGNSDVRLRATYSKNGATTSEEFDLTVLKKDQVPLTASLTGSISPISIPAGSDSTKTLTFTGASQSLIIGTDIEVRIKTRPNTAAEAHLSMGVNTGVLFPSTDIIPRDGGDYTIELSGIGNYTGTLDRTLNLTVTALPITSISYTAINAETSTALTAAAAPTVDPAEAAAAALFDIDTGFTSETGLSFNTGTGAISGTASAVIDKSYTVSITGGDGTKYEGSTQSTSIQVRVTLSDADSVADALSALDITAAVGGNLQAVTDDFTLPATGEEGTSISWEVLSGSAIDLSGTNNENAAVTRPSFTATDDDVLIKATVTKNGETDTKTFNLKVLKASSLSDAESVNQAKADLDIAGLGFASGDAFDSVTQDFTLPTTGSEGTTISWEVVSGSAIDLSGSSNEDAAVTRPGHTSGNSDVRLRATYSKNGATASEEFDLTVLKKDQVPLTASLTGSISPISIPAGSDSTKTLTFTGASQSLIIGTDIEVRIKTRPNTAAEAHLSMGVNTGVLFPSTDIIPRDGGDYTIELSGIGNYTGTLDRTLNLTVTALPITSISYTAINAETSTALTAAAAPTVDPAEAAAAALFDIDTGFTSETGLSFNTGTGAISGTASAVIDKSYTVSITGGDGTKYEGSTQSTSIQVRVTLSDADAVADALSALDITAAVGGNLQAVTDDFTLPATGEEGTSISWEVLSGSAIDLSGTNNENAAVTRPSFTATDDDVAHQSHRYKKWGNRY